MVQKLLKLLCVSGLLLLAPSCGLTLLSGEREVAMGLEAYPEATGQHREITSGGDYAKIQNALRKLIPFADADVREWYGKSFAWEAKLLDAPKTVNAWCLPGGKIAFYTGILPICQGEPGIAVVMSHEIAHAVLRHGNQRISQDMVLKGALKAGASLFGGGQSQESGSLLNALGVGVKYGLQLPFSRGHESEADAYGLELLVQAGYDPHEAVRLWKRMAARGSSGPEFMSTHPNPERRAAELEEMIPEVLAKYGKR